MSLIIFPPCKQSKVLLHIRWVAILYERVFNNNKYEIFSRIVPIFTGKTKISPEVMCKWRPR